MKCFRVGDRKIVHILNESNDWNSAYCGNATMSETQHPHVKASGFTEVDPQENIHSLCPGCVGKAYGAQVIDISFKERA